jgi:NADPH2:quinone reductase
MKIIRMHEYGEPSVMRLEDGPLPEPDAGMVRVKADYIGVNFIDIQQRSGQYRVPLPFTPGVEAAGIVDALGDGVTDFQLGQRVVFGFGVKAAYAEYSVAAADKLVPVPDKMDLALATAGLTQGMTAHFLSHDTFPLEPGHTALVHAAAGGTGQLLVQMAKMRGARVIGTVSTPQKLEIAKAAGADEVILYSQQDFEAETKRLTDGRGVDVVYDAVGKDTFEKSLNCLRPRGYMVFYGQASGPVPPFDVLSLGARGSLYITRPTLGHYTATGEETRRRASDVFNWMLAGKLAVTIDRTFPLAEAPTAHTVLAGRATQGKVLLVP